LLLLVAQSDFGAGDWRLDVARFSEENFHKNLELVDLISQIAAKKGVTPGQLSLAWILAQGDDFIPIPGTKKIKYLEENVKAVDVRLTKDEIAQVRKAIENIEIVGDRYPEAALGFLRNSTPQKK
jgi:aryl-alcohol dehydrogenase-like predicted oxidoreductase